MTSWLKDAAVIDFESLKINERPRHPPVPVGVAIRRPGEKGKYLAFGHPYGNTHCWSDARRELGELYDSGRPLIYHNAKFDVDVGEKHMELPRLSWDRYHDTLPVLFLLDPRAPDFALKSSAERILGRKAEERDAIVDWLVENQPVPGIKLSRSQSSDHYAGAYLAYAPPSLVGPYAIGDVDRTLDLARVIFKQLEKRDMLAPYDRERKLMLYLLEMEQQGVRLHLKKLSDDVALYEREFVRLESWVRKRLGASNELNLDSGVQLAEALINAKVASKEDFGVTPTGKMQTNKEALASAVKDPQILAVLKYRTQLGTCLETFMRPWLATASASGGFIFTEWHSTRRDRSGDGVGARTGRLSSTPNLMNIPNEFNEPFALVKPPYKLPSLPKVRSYVAPYEANDVLLDRDYSQQEPRILAHYEDGDLLKAYLDNPWVDYHDTAKARLAEYGLDLERKKVKIINLALIYGMGLGLMSEKTGLPIDKVKEIKAGILKVYSGLPRLYDDMKRRAKQGLPIRTWGGREYFCEPPKYDPKRKRMMEFDYKLPNVLIQGSAADCTKEAMLNFFERRPKKEWRLLITVHDELLTSVPRKDRNQAMEFLRDCMESVPFDVPMLSEGEWSDESWEGLEPFDKKGKKVVVSQRGVAA